MDRYIERILTAHIYDLAVETPLQCARGLSARLGQRVWIKREDLQPVFSFKIRGAYNRLLQLDEAQRQGGVVTASAGNHAQGVAMAATHLGMAATIFMPRTTPRIKVDAVAGHGAAIELFGDDLGGAYQEALRVAAERGAVFIPPYDDPYVIAGQGTVAMELCRQHSGPIDAIFVPVGGGGLIAGIAAYVKALCPKTRIVGVEPEDSACLTAALAAGTRVVLPQVGIFADGVAVRQIGAEPFAVLQGKVDEMITVSTDDICTAIKDIFQDNRSIAEPSGALAVAGLKRYVENNPELADQALVAIESGANMGFDRLRHVVERAEVGERREILLAVTIPEQCGSFLKFCQCLGSMPVTEFNYRVSGTGPAHIFLGVAIDEGEAAHHALVKRLGRAGYGVSDMSRDEMAKLHLRFMVGGRMHAARPERVFAVQFPERPGALQEFLERLGSRWNITLFHYRNHGAAFGRVLVGIEAADGDLPELKATLDGVGYRYQDHTDDAGYGFFLA